MLTSLGCAPPLKHASILLIRQGTSDAITECEKVLDSTVLNASTGLLNTNTPDANNVLNNFNRLHNTWFSVHGFALSVSNNMRTHDLGESSLYVTRFLFANSSYDGILTEDRVPMGLRTTHQTLAREIVTRNAALEVIDTKALANVVSTAEKSILVQQGLLKGITWREGDNVLDYKTLADPNHPLAQRPSIANLNVKTNAHLGNGILGLPSYYMSNYPYTTFDTGATSHPRRWARNVLSDLLCRDPPFIRLEDAEPFVDTTSEQKIPYRRDQTCMRCHATLDPMASTARNYLVTLRHVDTTKLPTDAKPAFSFVGSGAANILGTNRFLYWLEKLPASKGNLDVASLKTESGNPLFSLYNPTGRLNFRTYDGQLVDNVALEDMAALSAQLRSLDDLYVCAARRYFEHFTGIRVSLQDIEDKNEAGLSPDDLHYRDIVVKLGTNFAKDEQKSLRTLIKKIMELPLYRSPNLRFTTSHIEEIPK